VTSQTQFVLSVPGQGDQIVRSRFHLGCGYVPRAHDCGGTHEADTDRGSCDVDIRAGGHILTVRNLEWGQHPPKSKGVLDEIKLDKARLSWRIKDYTSK
jgi:hypothetical protein